jgi:hypothetical protein
MSTAQSRPRPAPTPATTLSPARHLGLALYALAAAIALNSLLGPALLGLVDYPFSETLRNQTIGLELFSLLVVAPVSVWAGIRLRRGDATAAAVALAPAGYAVYMLVQYVVGPQYDAYPTVLLLHLPTFVLAGYVLLAAWSLTRAAPLPKVRPRWAWALLALTLLLVSRYIDAFVGVATGADLPAEFAADVSMYWTIVLLDLGVVLPLGLAAAAALRTGSVWGAAAAYALVGWYALVPPSVLAMAITMVMRNDPHGDPAKVVLFAVLSLVYLAAAGALFRPLLRRGDAGR